MSDIVADVIASLEPETPDSGAPAVNTEVADQERVEEGQGQEADKPEAAEKELPESDKELDRLKKEAFSLRRRLDKQTANRHRAEERAAIREVEVQRYLEAAGIQQGRQQAPNQPVDPNRIAQEVMQRERPRIEQEMSAVHAIESIEKGNSGFVNDLKALQAEIGELLTDDQLPSPLLNAFLECDAPAKIVKHLRNDPELAASLEGLSPTRLGRKLQQIESELLAPKKTVSSAPAPVRPVSASGRGVKDAGDMDIDELWAEAKRGKR